jgi:hypothetical protein
MGFKPGMQDVADRIPGVEPNKSREKGINRKERKDHKE